MEGLAGLNFCDFHGYQEYHKSFPVNITLHKYLLYYTKNTHFWPRQHESISTLGLKLRMFSLANLSMSMVVLRARPFLLFVFGVKKIPDKKVWHTRQDVTFTGSVGQQYNSKHAVISKQRHTQSS